MFNDTALIDTDRHVFVWNGPHGKVHVGVEKTGTGLYLYLDDHEQPVAKVDLFYPLEQIDGQLGGQYPQLVIYDTQQDEAVAFVAFKADRTRVFFEHGVTDLRERDDETIYGYRAEATVQS